MKTINLRIPDDLDAFVRREAKRSGRSINAEIVKRLESGRCADLIRTIVREELLCLAR